MAGKKTRPPIRVERLDDYRWRIPQTGRMLTEGIVYADDALFARIRQDQSLEQVRNVACLPGIVGPSLAMPDIHWGYGFPIGGVAAFDPAEGIVSPGGVGYDINCGVRLLRSNLTRKEITPNLKAIADALFRDIPAGVGRGHKEYQLDPREVRQVLEGGAAWAVEQGFGTEADLDHIEEGGRLAGADAGEVSDRAVERGRRQLGTVGSGNHFIEVGYVAEIHDAAAASAFGLAKNHVTVFIHSGSRGLGYQVCDDFISVMLEASSRYGIDLPDRQLCCAPLRSPEGKRYLAAMSAAANFAFANRQLMAHRVRETFRHTLGLTDRDLRMGLVYDVCHNIAKFETHQVEGRSRRLCVHRKGATRAFPGSAREVPADYRKVGQPVLIPGDMGRRSYVLAGAEGALSATFGSACHGAGRVMSRNEARRVARGRELVREFEERGIFLRGAGRATLVEEIPEAYKDVTEVVDVVEGAGLARKVAELRPLAVIKG
ncbi:MAG: RtcB family protein [Deltaproteobacteria bacterium]|nr:RtcB family protein [Deltaproteobacteria bacterium]